MRVTVTQLNALDLEESWESLVAHTISSATDFVLLPEMPFATWLAATSEVDPAAWLHAVEQHVLWIERMDELGSEVVVATRPVIDGGARFNEAFVWRDGEVAPWRRKTYLPNEPGFWEASWYERGPVEFPAFSCRFGPLGTQICTEMWFFEHARDYATAGVRILTTPRATEAATTDKWLAGGRVAAVSAGAYALSSNHVGAYDGVTMGGSGWVVSPDGEVLATTIDSEPFVTVDIDVAIADAAKSTYPRYVDSTPI